MSEQDFKKLGDDLSADRSKPERDFGRSTGEFELIRETALSPSIVRLVYLEKFERGGMAWFFTLYHGKDGWRVDGVHLNRNLDSSLINLS